MHSLRKVYEVSGQWGSRVCFSTDFTFKLYNGFRPNLVLDIYTNGEDNVDPMLKHCVI